MSQIKIISLLSGMLLILLLSGCGNKNSQVVIDSTTQTHFPGWVPLGHKQAAIADINSCTSCHGEDFAGGISKVSCTSCHLGGVTSVHPAGWNTSADLTSGLPLHGAYVGLHSSNNGTASCRNTACHGANLEGVADSGHACVLCHSTALGNTPALPWL